MFAGGFGNLAWWRRGSLAPHASWFTSLLRQQKGELLGAKPMSGLARKARPLAQVALECKLHFFWQSVADCYSAIFCYGFITFHSMLFVTSNIFGVCVFLATLNWILLDQLAQLLLLNSCINFPLDCFVTGDCAENDRLSTPSVCRSIDSMYNGYNMVRVLTPARSSIQMPESYMQSSRATNMLHSLTREDFLTC